MSVRAKELGPKGLAHGSWGKSMVIPSHKMRNIYKWVEYKYKIYNS